MILVKSLLEKREEYLRQPGQPNHILARCQKTNILSKFEKK